MEVYLRVFVNWEQNDWARLLPMAEFAYNNAKNTSTDYTPFKYNCGYHPKISFEEDINHCLRSRSTKKLAKEMRELIKSCYQNLFYIQELQKKAHNKRVKSCSYALDKKV